MNTESFGKYASVSDLPYTTQKITYHRGYGNIVVHEVKGDNSVSTNITKYNRIDPLTAPFNTDDTTIAWADKRFYE